MLNGICSRDWPWKGSAQKTRGGMGLLSPERKTEKDVIVSECWSFSLLPPHFHVFQLLNISLGCSTCLHKFLRLLGIWVFLWKAPKVDSSASPLSKVPSKIGGQSPSAIRQASQEDQQTGDASLLQTEADKVAGVGSNSRILTCLEHQNGHQKWESCTIFRET